jgi:hypothetical protein
MTSKLPQEKYSQENSQIMFQIFIFNQKSSRKGTNVTFLNFF